MPQQAHRVRREEGAGLGPMAMLCSALIGLGSSLVLSAGDALFLHRVGPEHLGTAFAISSAMLVVVLSAVGARADRGRRDTLLFSIAAISAVILVGAAILTATVPKAAAAVVLVGGKQMAAALELSFWVLLAERFDARQLRRALPRLIAAQGAGLALGAGLVALGAQVAGVPAIALSGAVAFLAAGFVAKRVARRGALRPLPRAELPARRGRFALFAGAAAVRASPVASLLVVLVVLGGASTPIIHYLLGVRASAAFTDEASLATFFGGFRAAVQIATVLAQAVIASRLISRAGIGTIIVCAPAVAIVCAIALLVRPELLAIVIAQAVIKLVDGAIETPAHKLAQNLTGREARGRISGFLDGVAKRAGAIVGGVLAATLAPSPVTVALLIIAALWLVSSLVFRARFPELAVRELSARASNLPVGDGEVELDRAGVIALRDALISGGAAAVRARTLLAELDGNGVDYSRELVRALPSCEGESRRALAQELGARLDCGQVGSASEVELAALAASGDRSLELLAARLGVAIEVEPTADDDSDQAAELAIVTALAGKRASGTLSLDDFGSEAIEDRELCRAVASAELDTGDEPRAVRRLVRISKGTGAAPCERAALVALRRFAERRLEALDDSPTLAAEWMLLSGSLAELAERLAIGSPRAPIRAAALELWTTIGGSRVAPEVAGLLGASDRIVARAAADALARLGADAVEALLRVAVFGRRRAREPALDLLRELRVPPAVLDELIDREADLVAASATRLPALAGLEGGDLLRRRVEERLAESAHTLFLLLETRLGRSAIGTAARRLRHARHRAAKARAIEALDAALPRRFAPLLGTLEGTGPTGRARAAARFLGDELPDADRAMRDELAGEDRLARRIAIFALGKGGRSQFADDITQAAEGAFAHADPGEVAARLASVLGTGDNEPDDMSRSIESVMVLSELALFTDLTTRELAELAEVVSWVSARAGQVLISEGEVGDAMYFVVDGEVVVERQSADGEKVVATLGRGEPFGEMALFDDEVRSATVTAADAARLGRIERPAFEEIVAEVPGIALGICRALSRRVRNLE